MRHRWAWRIMKGVGIFVIASLLLSLIVMLLWNALVPALFAGPELSYLQALGLLLLSHILLRGWGPWRHANGWRHERWRRRFEEKLAAMTPEEREKFKAEWRNRCGWAPGETGGSDQAGRAQS